MIIDDNEELQERLSEYLTEFGYQVTSLLTGINILQDLQTSLPDIIILDIMLPDKDGFEILKEIRSLYSIPVLMLTAKGEDMDRILGLELGADDYLPKPFNPRELVARLKAILRRTAENTEASKKNNVSQIIQCGKLQLDPTRNLLIWNQKQTEISATEFRIIEVLMHNQNQIISRDRIMELAHQKNLMAFDRSIDVQVSRIRTKLKDLTGSGDWIKTYRGSGYMLADIHD